jgi:hypothetical protein
MTASTARASRVWAGLAHRLAELGAVPHQPGRPRVVSRSMKLGEVTGAARTHAAWGGPRRWVRQGAAGFSSPGRGAAAAVPPPP